MVFGRLTCIFKKTCCLFIRSPSRFQFGSRSRTNRPRARIKNLRWPPKNTRDIGSLIFCSYSKRMRELPVPGSNDLGCSVTPIFLLMDHFLYRFSKYSGKKEEKQSTRSLISWQNSPSNSIIFIPSFTCEVVLNAS